MSTSPLELRVEAALVGCPPHDRIEAGLHASAPDDLISDLVMYFELDEALSLVMDYGAAYISHLRAPLAWSLRIRLWGYRRL